MLAKAGRGAGIGERRLRQQDRRTHRRQQIALSIIKIQAHAARDGLLDGGRRLLALSEPVLKLVEDGTLSAGHARALLPLSDPEMQLAAAKTVIEKGLSVRRAEALAAQLLKDTQEKPAKKAAGVDYLGECARHLEQVLGRKVRMTQGRKTGRIELEYYDADDREALLQALEAIGRRN